MKRRTILTILDEEHYPIRQASTNYLTIAKSIELYEQLRRLSKAQPTEQTLYPANPNQQSLYTCQSISS